MSIKYAILGFLSWQPLTGYDLKKRFAESGTLPWSGNNNQIYKSLLELHKDGSVTLEVQHQDSLPSRKIYTITEAGRAELRDWVLSSPDAPQVRHSFLVQLAWADQLSHEELDTLFDQYEAEISVQLAMARTHQDRKLHSPERTPREAYLWHMIAENSINFYQGELTWVRQLRADLNRMHREGR